MYEGLTRDILDRVIPAGLHVTVTHGFIRGVDGELSPQIDAMIVAGEGAEIPHAEGHVWPLADVIAVMEVKKSLYGADLRDGFDKLRRVMHMNDRLLQAKQGRAEDITPSYRAFARLTGRYPSSWEEADQLPDDLSYPFHAIVAEQLAPVRILMGFQGYVDESALRKGMAKFLQENEAQAGFGVTSFPDLIVARDSSLLKMNGHPYISPRSSTGWWPFLASNNENPLRILVELIWTRLSNRFSAYFPMDDTLRQERLAPFLSARFGRQGDQAGWHYNLHSLKPKELAAAEPSDWEPSETDVTESVVLMQIARKGRLDVHEAAFRKWAKEEGFDADALIERLVAQRLLAWESETTVRLVGGGTLVTAFLPGGESVTTGETDLLGLWTLKKLDERRTMAGDED